ncbi:alpha/beta fold hydrolase [Granulosicoccus antarcticus]|uniref:AB hydrolase superfamily protein YvaM n=1 Tax=Granulosicoccus antarcticus IMCC3135 TaxID=1192854 RepID=A0A2Z2NX14_9GAMM|nr:alpha/beta hydrolase [Granulosicoccus antarcticus]ASJ75972.1 AB hydrolase superfamily protein YvaM [Granulosicoccus antarcticus IMCC3135]
MKVQLDGETVFVGQGGVEWLQNRRTLLLQHGAGMDRTVWVLLARYFARHGFNVVTPDLPGHGASGGEALSSIDAQASFIWRLLDHLQAEHGLPDTPVILGGHSMGSLVVAEAAGQRADKVEHLLLVGAGYPMPVAQPLLDAANANQQSAVDMIAIYSHCHESQLGHNPVAGISAFNSAKALLERCAPGVLHADLFACNAYAGLDQVASVFPKGKTTVVVGDADRMTPMRMSRNLVDGLGAELIVLDTCGHMIMSEQPEQTLQAIKHALQA